jgi:hypothetical protein
MRRRWIYLVAMLGFTATAGAGSLLGDPDTEETPLWIYVNAADDYQPEQFTAAVGDVIEFASGPRRVELRIQGEPGVLGDLSVSRLARFQFGSLRVQNGGVKCQSIKAKKPGTAKVEVTSHHLGSRREIREFNITVVDKRKEKVPVMETMPSPLYGSPGIVLPTTEP